MPNSFEKIARILNIPSEALLNIDKKMSSLTGRHGVMDMIAKQNDEAVDRVLADLKLTRSSTAEEVYRALTEQLIRIDEDMFELLGKPDLSKLSDDPGKLAMVALEIFTPSKGLFIKKEKITELLEKHRPQSLLDHFGYKAVSELLEKEGFASVVSALRFTQTTEWMHDFFEIAYKGLGPDDFEERDVQIKVLEPKWLGVAEKFLEKKFHNVSHLKEYGIIFIIPLPIDTPGETLRMFTLLLHYLHEVPFYTGLFRRFINDSDFISKFQSLLRGDVSDRQMPDGSRIVWRVVQRYLAKDDPNDFRLTEPHINPEAEHWFRVGEDLTRLARMFGREEGGMNLSYWTGLDCIGDFFIDKDGNEKLVSFDLIDLIMSLVKKGEIKYLYHQQESMWNKIFSEYVGREKMNQLVEENIIKGYVEL